MPEEKTAVERRAAPEKDRLSPVQEKKGMVKKGVRDVRRDVCCNGK